MEKHGAKYGFSTAGVVLGGLSGYQYRKSQDDDDDNDGGGDIDINNNSAPVTVNTGKGDPSVKTEQTVVN